MIATLVVVVNDGYALGKKGYGGGEIMAVMVGGGGE